MRWWKLRLWERCVLSRTRRVKNALVHDEETVKMKEEEMERGEEEEGENDHWDRACLIIPQRPRRVIRVRKMWVSSARRHSGASPPQYRPCRSAWPW